MSKMTLPRLGALLECPNTPSVYSLQETFTFFLDLFVFILQKWRSNQIARSRIIGKDKMADMKKRVCCPQAQESSTGKPTVVDQEITEHQQKIHSMRKLKKEETTRHKEILTKATMLAIFISFLGDLIFGVFTYE